MFVDAPVSSRKTSFVMSRAGWAACHSRRAACTSVRSCSLACRVFFKRELPFIELMPQGGYLDRNPVCRQSGAQLRECQISCFLQPGPQRRLHPRHPGLPVAPNWQTAPLSRLRQPVPHLIHPDPADFKSVGNGGRTVPTFQCSQHPVP